MCSGIVVWRPRPPPRRWTATRSPLQNSSIGALGDAGVELLADQPVRHRVVMPVDVDVIVEPDPARPPFGILVGLGRQRLQRRAVEFDEQLAPADAEAAHRPRVEVGDQLRDRRGSARPARRSAGCAAAPVSSARPPARRPRPWPCRAACAAASAGSRCRNASPGRGRSG